MFIFLITEKVFCVFESNKWTICKEKLYGGHRTLSEMLDYQQIQRLSERRAWGRPRALWRDDGSHLAQNASGSCRRSWKVLLGWRTSGEPAASTTRPQKSRRIRTDVVHFFKDNSVLQKLCHMFKLQKGFNSFVIKKSKRRNHLTVFCLIWRLYVFKLDCSAWFRWPDLLVICLRCVHSSPPCLTRCTCRVSHNNCLTDSEPRQENPVNLIY